MKRFLPLPLLCHILVITVALTATLRAEPVKVSQKIVLEDGSPVAKAEVLVRSIDERTGLANGEQVVTTDGEGIFSAQLDVPDGTRSFGYVLVKAPGKAIFYEPFYTSNGSAPLSDPVLKLTSSAQISGSIRNAAGAGVAGAVVEIRSFTDDPQEKYLYFNSQKTGLQTPWLRTVTDQSGNYSLRPVVFKETPSAQGTYVVLARADIGGVLFTGRGDVSSYKLLNRPETQYDLALQATTTLRGRVENLVTHAPIAGATVELKGFMANDVPMVQTNAAGQWELKGAPPTAPLFVLVSAPNYGDNYLQLTADSDHRLLGPAIDPIVGPTIALPPLIEVSGVIRDATSGQSATVPLFLRTWTSGGYNDGNFSVSTRDQAGKVDATGRFAIRVPAGKTRFKVEGVGYQSDLTLDVPAQGLSDQKWAVQRADGVLLQICTKNPQGIAKLALLVRQGGMAGEVFFHPSYHFLSADKLKRGVEIRAVRHVEGTDKEVEVLPWTKIDPSETRWPLTFDLP